MNIANPAYRISHEIRCLPLLVWLLSPLMLAGQPDYTTYDNLLTQYVSTEGTVDYAGLKKNMPFLRKAVADMTHTPPAHAWTREQQMAYWINLYNAATLLLVAEHYPVPSIRDIGDGKPWDMPCIEAGGRALTLNEIEHDILRAKFRDARIHFALTCAAVSCPPLMNSAYRPESLESQLEERTRRFIRSPANELSTFKARLSEIFNWYKTDFGDPVAFINRYSEVKVLAAAAITYIPYDWSLND